MRKRHRAVPWPRVRRAPGSGPAAPWFPS